MANIEITNRQGVVVASVADNQVNEPAPAGTTSVSIVGRNIIDYGDEIGDNFHWLMENFANTTPPAGAVTGQLWFDISSPATPSMKVYNEIILDWVGVTRLEDDDTPTLKAGSNMNANSNRIISLAYPISDSDASTKFYVDEQIGLSLGLASDTFVGLTDTPGTYLGNAAKVAKVTQAQDGLEFSLVSFVELSDTPSLLAGAENKIVKVNGSANALEFITLTLEDIPVSGHLNMNGFRIEALGTPNSSDDVMNLGYADDRYLRDTASDINGIPVRISDTGATVARQLESGSAITVVNGDGVSGNPTISHGDTSSQNSIDNTGNTVIQDITVDTFGHITAIGSKTLSIISQAEADDRYIRDTFGNANGFVVRTSSTGESVGRSLTAGGGISITNTNGVSGNPVISHSNTSSIGDINNSGTTVVQDLNFDTYGHVVSANSVTIPANSTPEGVVQAWAGGAAPTGYLLCDGSMVNRGTYPNLFAALGTTYGSSNASNFGIPNLKGRGPIGYNVGSGVAVPGITTRARGSSGGSETHTLTEAQLASHDHDYIIGSGDGSNTRAPASRGDTNYPDANGPYQTENAGGNQPHNIMQPFLVMDWIIKHDEVLGAPLAAPQAAPPAPADDTLNSIDWADLVADNAGSTTATVSGIDTTITLRATITSGSSGPESFIVYVNAIAQATITTIGGFATFNVVNGDEVSFAAAVSSNSDAYSVLVQNVTDGNITIDTFDVTVTLALGGGGGGGGGCLEVSTPILLPDGSYKRIDELEIGDKIASYVINGMPDESDENWKDWITESLLGSLGQTTIKYIDARSYHYHYVINGNIQVTYEHPFLIKRDGLWSWIDAENIQVGDYMIAPDGSDVLVDTFKRANTEIDVITMNVEDTDVYFAGNINGTPVLVHNIPVTQKY